MDPVRIERTLKALNKNHLNGEFVKNSEELMRRLREEIPEGSIAAAGSSMTLAQLGIREWLEKGSYWYIHCGDGADDRRQNILNGFRADFYLSSVAAITERGELFLVDGTGNRTAAFSYGPKHVIVVASVKKIVADLEEARGRLRKTAAPLCAQRREKTELPCFKTGECRDCCLTGRMCCYFLTVGYSRDADRFHVYLLDEDAGY